MVKVALTQEEQKIQSALLNRKYDKAQKILEGAGSQVRPVYRAIFAASISFMAGDELQAWESIAEGLRLDGHNYELYMLLGEYYTTKNLQQAYLCYENALFYCGNQEDGEQIRTALEQLSEQGGACAEDSHRDTFL